MCGEQKSIIHFVRHGECLGNVRHIFYDSHPEQDVLTEKGILQAQLLGRYWQNVPFTAAYTSDYPRTVSTAENILVESKVAAGLQLRRDPRLRERYFGKFEDGADVNDCLDDFDASGQSFFEYVSDGGGESTEDMERRIESFLEEIFQQIDTSEAPQTILVVTHSVFLVHMLRYLLVATKLYSLKNWEQSEHIKMCRNTEFFTFGVSKVATEAGSTPRELEVLTACGCDHLKFLDGTMTKSSVVAFNTQDCVQQ